MPLRQIPRRTLHWALLSLVFCLAAAPLDLHIVAQTTTPADAAQPSDSTPTATGDTPMPTHPYVLPPTNVRPSAPAIVDDKTSTPAPHPIILPPPPDAAPAKATARTTKRAPHKTAPTPKTEVAARPTAAPAPVATPPAKTAPAPAIAATAAPRPATTAPAAVIAPPIVAPTPAPVPVPTTQPSPSGTAQTATTPGAPSDLGASTFGFYAGETRDQIITAIGQTNVLKQQGDILEVAAAPKPDPNFDSFLLIVGPTTGLVKLIATGKDIDDDATGRQMKLQFTALKTDLAKGYGEPSDNFDFLDVKATHRSAGQFMLALTNNERSLAAYWTKKDFGNQITSISLSGNGLGDDTGYLSVEYEFAGYHAYLAAKK